MRQGWRDRALDSGFDRARDRRGRCRTEVRDAFKSVVDRFKESTLITCGNAFGIFEKWIGFGSGGAKVRDSIEDDVVRPSALLKKLDRYSVAALNQIALGCDE